MAEQPWQGSALLRPGVLAFTGTIGATDPHAHHAVQIMTAPTAMTIVDGTGARHRGTKVIVPADAPHRIDTGAARGCLVFLDPESTAGRAAHHRSIHLGWITGPVLSRTRERPLGAVVTDLIRQLTPVPADAIPQRHTAVLAALDLLADLTGPDTVRGTELAAQVGISASRLTHLFTAQVGIPLRRYVLWRRLGIAITRVGAGDDLTEAAHAAGFADSSHLGRTCRDMFGLPPSLLSRHVCWDIDTND
jgi:AraC-like DNA-binding protein